MSVLRILKLVAQPRYEEDVLRRFSSRLDEFEEQPGFVSAHLFRDRSMRNKYFVYTFWKSREDLRAYSSSAFAEEIQSGIGTVVLERPKLFELRVVDVDTRPLQAAELESVRSRMISVNVRPGQNQAMEDAYFSTTDGFTRRQPGCLRVRLYHSFEQPTNYFIQSYWADQESMERVLAAERIQQQRTEAVKFLEERMQTWTLDVVADGMATAAFKPVKASDLAER